MLVEGFKRATIPKIEVYRAAVGKHAPVSRDRMCRAVATDSPAEIEGASIPVVGFEQRGGYRGVLIRNSAVLPIDFQGTDL